MAPSAAPDLLLLQLGRFLPGYIYQRSASDCAQVFALDGKVEEVTGYAAEALLVPGALAARIYGPDRHLVEDVIADAVRREGSFELEYRLLTARGEARWVWETGVVCNGQVYGFVSDQLPGLGRRRRLLEAQRRVLDVATSEHVTGGDLIAVAEAICQACVDWLKVQRVGVWLLSEDESRLDLVSLFTTANNQRVSGASVRREDYPNYFAALVTGRAIDADHVRTDPRTCEFNDSYLIPNDIHSMLDAAVRSGDRILGVICCEQTGAPRHWSPDDINFAAEMADQFAHTLANKSAQEARDKALRAEAANQAKSHFLATITHELRTPLNGVLGMTDLLRDTPLDARQREIVDTLSRSGELLLSVINDVLDFSRIEAGKLDIFPSATELGNLMAGTVDMFRAQALAKGLTLALSVPDGPHWLMLDSTRLQQVLANLLSNAVKFSERGRIQVEVLLIDDRVQIDVCDEGEGISAELRGRLFQPFEQARRQRNDRTLQGTGLGLAISKRIIEAMGGKLSVHSTLGVGSTFRVTLPRLPAEPDVAVPEEEDKQPLALSVWVAEDNPVNQLVIQGLLQHRQIDTRLFENGEQLLTALRASGALPDLVLMDCEMPVMDGFAATIAIRNDPRLRALPVVALTAHVMPEFRHRSALAGMDGYLTKPLQRRELDRILSQYQRA
jgi:signal transduction histidine kinase